ncbi:MAG TPA: hypothetical protein VL244_17040 [Alphaproteobacteria bacterium]|nr:hypothetical protein [Alphaproteobacteria bacterium]
MEILVPNAAVLEETGLRGNGSVKRIFTALQPNADGSWDVVTVVETSLVLDAARAGYDQEACDKLVEDVESDLRARRIFGRVTLRGA